jgi:uncharacterized protein YyaL (SSP411 family)
MTRRQLLVGCSELLIIIIPQTFIQATQGRGGWPMSVWLTPALHPIAGGTYFPPNDPGFGRPGFTTLLLRIARLWQQDTAQVRAQAAAGFEAMQTLARLPAPRAQVPGLACVDECFAQLSARYDPEHGGFGVASKFPRPVELTFLLRVGAGSGTMRGRATYAGRALTMAVHTLHMMGRGGMRDQLGGGFHRYSVDARWRVPHFEIMLYDCAQLLGVYAEAYAATGDEALADVARGIIGYVLSEMRSPQGAFFCGQDADSLPYPRAAHKVGVWCTYIHNDAARMCPRRDPALTAPIPSHPTPSNLILSHPMPRGRVLRVDSGGD